MKKLYGLWRKGGSEGQTNLLEAYRTINKHDVELDGDIWKATGSDPYLVYQLDRRANHGALIVELDIKVFEGRISPRIFFQTRKGFSQASSELMRRIGAGRYKLTVFLSHPCTALRMDPAEASCSFRVQQFTIRRTKTSTFLARVLRNGANADEVKP